MTDTQVHESDWLASSPVFYSEMSRSIGGSVTQVVRAGGAPSIHEEGLYNYLEFGYSVFGQTPIAGIKFLPPASRLRRNDQGSLVLEKLPDPIERWMTYRLSESDVIELIRERVRAWEASLPSDRQIILPLSGGFDSRLLLWCLRDKSRVRAFTYGISGKQDRSTEVAHARALVDHFNLQWERIELGDFHSYLGAWESEFGASTHAHGMYHYEFYSKIRERIAGEPALLSGIVGDAWAGSIKPFELNGEADLSRLGYAHGVNADPRRLNFSPAHQLRNQFWTEHRELLKEHRYQVVTVIRFKLILLSYLMRVPRIFGFHSWTPYLDIDIAMAMLNLPQQRRLNRLWQREFFEKEGLDLEGRGIVGDPSNNLDLVALRRHPLPPLNFRLLGRFFDVGYIDWINRSISHTSPGDSLKNMMLSLPKLGGALRRLGATDDRLPAYNAYMCVKPIENLLKRP